MTQLDGRRARAERSRAAIVDAFLALLPAASRRPTVEEIAAEAGVSERSVYRHFPDVESLVHAAIGRRVEVMAPLADLSIDPSVPLAERIREVAARRGEFYETALPLRRFTEPTSVEMPELVMLARARRVFLRDQLLAVFEPELDRRDGSRARLQDALEVAASWATWQHLREEQELSMADARRVLELSLLSLLSPEPSLPDLGDACAP
jgi:TetR/AcrR family transcriptional regulator, regulator of autoinduction and epiphytic fitness